MTAVAAQADDSTTAPLAAKAGSLRLRGAKVAVEVQWSNDGIRERFLAPRGGKWIEVAAAGDSRMDVSTALITAGQKRLRWQVRSVAMREGTLQEDLESDAGRITRQLAIVGAGSWVRVVTRFEPFAPVELQSFSDVFLCSPGIDWAYSPSVGGFNPDAQYKAPLILVQAGQEAFGIVPDLAVLDREELIRCNHALDLDVPAGPRMAVGFMPARLASHSIYARDTQRHWRADGPIENCYFLLVTASATPGEAFRDAVRFHWDRFGRPAQAHAADQQTGTDSRYAQRAHWLRAGGGAEDAIPDVDSRYCSLSLWEQWRAVVWEKEAREQWVSVRLPNGTVGGGVQTMRWGPGPAQCASAPRAVYLSSWFNSLRTSFGLALYARRERNPELLRLAQQTVQLALHSPGTNGAFKCIAVPLESDTTVWAAGDGAGASTDKGYLGYDMSWTGYWLLRWQAAGLPGPEDIIPRCQQLARFFLERQEAKGMLPTRFNEDGSVQAEASATVKAETGPVALFLLQLYERDQKPEHLAAARRGLEFLEREVIPSRQWYDYETFWSCSPRLPRLDERTQQWPANNLALAQTVAAYLLAFRLTGAPHYLATGEALLDYLLLYQQCWTNPVLENLRSPTLLLGGFTTMNSDAEWSDARQSQCGNILLDYYRVTGKAEYLERGVAALRAQFPISPSENWAHTGYGGKSGVSSFHWGTGSGMAGIEMDAEFLGDAVVDVPSGRGVGVNGLNVGECVVSGNQIRLAVSSPFNWLRKPVVVFHRAVPWRNYHVTVNGARLGRIQGKVLAQGLPLPLPRSAPPCKPAG